MCQQSGRALRQAGQIGGAKQIVAIEDEKAIGVDFAATTAQGVASAARLGLPNRGPIRDMRLLA